MVKAKIHSCETMGALDGPGIRYVLFMKGCPLRCAFCHNPDTWASAECEEKSAQEVADDVIKYSEFFKATGGGFTASGGEPLLQADFLAELLPILKAENITSAIDTCGCVDINDSIKKVVDLADLFLLDIKHLDSTLHKKITAKGNDKVLKFLEYLNSQKKEIHIRIVLLNGISSDENYIERLAKFLKKYPTISRVDLLPYHNLGVKKWEALGLEYKLDDNALVPTQVAEKAKEIFEEEGFFTTLQ